MDEARRKRAEALLQRRDAGGGERRRADAVIRGLARDDDVSLRPALGVPGETDELDRGLDALRASVREEHVVKPRRRKLGELRRETDRRLVREVPERRVELEPAHLHGRRLGELRAAVADGALPEPARAVDVLVPLDVPETSAVAARPDDRILGTPDDRVRMDHMSAIELVQVHSACRTVLKVVYSSIVCGPCS